jgi:phosphoribosyl 1,2-cyclic phosphodiesterase
VRVDLCGVRGSTPAPGGDYVRYGGHTSCVALSADEDPRPSLILDAGTGLREILGLAGEAFRGTLLLTHLHWDHIQGLPFFSAGDRADSQVEMLIPEQGDGGAALPLMGRMMSPPFFPIGPDDLRGDWRFGELEPGTSSHGPFEVLAREIPHKGGRTFGYRVSDGMSTVTYMPDHCPTSLGPGPDGYGEYHEAAIELASGSDLLIHDSQLLPAEMGTDAMLGHSCGEYALALARHAGARSVLLFHHRPDRTDSELDRIAAAFASSDPPVGLARQGTTLQL